MTRAQAIKRRNLFVALVAAIFVLSVAIIAVIVAAVIGGKDGKSDASEASSVSSDISSVTTSGDTSSKDETSSVDSSNNSSSEESSTPTESSSSEATSSVTTPSIKKEDLDPEYSRLLLVNGSNPLPENYNSSGNLMLIEDKYLCGWRNQLDKDVMPYAIAMVEAAWADGVELYILSPYRSYDAQVTLFENEVKEWLGGWCECHKWNKKKENCQKTITRVLAEEKASTEVARPGTSEHHTGLAIDFNSVSPTFENTAMYKWLDKNAQDYGFILRYTEEKQSITGVIHEAWHWRFVGINEAKKIKASGLCLEEYLEQNN